MRQSNALSSSHVHARQQTTTGCKSSCTITNKINKAHITIIHVHSVREAMQMPHMKSYKQQQKQEICISRSNLRHICGAIV
jgi:hypothetical protein